MTSVLLQCEDPAGEEGGVKNRGWQCYVLCLCQSSGWWWGAGAPCAAILFAWGRSGTPWGADQTTPAAHHTRGECRQPLHVKEEDRKSVRTQNHFLAIRIGFPNSTLISEFHEIAEKNVRNTRRNKLVNSDFLWWQHHHRFGLNPGVSMIFCISLVFSYPCYNTHMIWAWLTCSRKSCHSQFKDVAWTCHCLQGQS